MASSSPRTARLALRSAARSASCMARTASSGQAARKRWRRHCSACNGAHGERCCPAGKQVSWHGRTRPKAASAAHSGAVHTLPRQPRTVDEIHEPPTSVSIFVLPSTALYSFATSAWG